MYDLDTELMRLQHTRPLEHAFENSPRLITSARENELWMMSGRKNSSTLAHGLPQSEQNKIEHCSLNNANNTQALDELNAPTLLAKANPLETFTNCNKNYINQCTNNIDRKEMESLVEINDNTNELYVAKNNSNRSLPLHNNDTTTIICNAQSNHDDNKMLESVNTRKDHVDPFTQTLSHSPLSNPTPCSNRISKIIKRRPQHTCHEQHVLQQQSQQYSSFPWQEELECSNGMKSCEHNHFNNVRNHGNSQNNKKIGASIDNNNDDDGGEVCSREELANTPHSRKHHESSLRLLNNADDTNITTTQSSLMPRSTSLESTHEQATQTKFSINNNTTYNLHTNKPISTKLLHGAKYIHTALPTNEEETNKRIKVKMETSQANMESVQSSLPMQYNKYAAQGTKELLSNSAEIFAKEQLPSIDTINNSNYVNYGINTTNNIQIDQDNLYEEQISGNYSHKRVDVPCEQETHNTLVSNVEFDVNDNHYTEYEQKSHEHPHYTTTESIESSVNNIINDKETSSTICEIPTVSSSTVTSEPALSLPEANATNTFDATINERRQNNKNGHYHKNYFIENCTTLAHSAHTKGKEQLALKSESWEHVNKLHHDEGDDNCRQQTHEPQTFYNKNKSLSDDHEDFVTMESSKNKSHIETTANETSNWLSTASLSSLPSFTSLQIVEDVDDKCEPIPRAHPPVQTEHTMQLVQESKHSNTRFAERDAADVILLEETEKDKINTTLLSEDKNITQVEKETVSAERNSENINNTSVTYLYPEDQLVPTQSKEMPLPELAIKELNVEKYKEEEIESVNNSEQYCEAGKMSDHECLLPLPSKMIVVTDNTNENTKNIVTEEPMKLISIVSKEGNQSVEWVVHPTRHEFTPLIPRLPLAEVVARREKRKRAVAEKQNAHIGLDNHSTIPKIIPNNNTNNNSNCSSFDKKLNSCNAQHQNYVLQSLTSSLYQPQLHSSSTEFNHQGTKYPNQCPYEHLPQHSLPTFTNLVYAADNLSDDGLWCKSNSSNSPSSTSRNTVIHCYKKDENNSNASCLVPVVKTTKSKSKSKEALEEPSNKMKQHHKYEEEEREEEESCSVQSDEPQANTKSNLNCVAQPISKAHNLHCTVPHTSSIADDLYYNSIDVTVVNISPVNEEIDKSAANTGDITATCFKASNERVNEKVASPGNSTQVYDASSNSYTKHEYERMCRNNTNECVHTNASNNFSSSINGHGQQQEESLDSILNKGELTRNSMTKTNKATHCCVMM